MSKKRNSKKRFRNSENARVVYQEYAHHARHVELQRQAFAALFVVAFSGVFVVLESKVIHQGHGEMLFQVVALVPAALSLVGFFVTGVWNKAYVVYSRKSEKIALDYLGLPDECAVYKGASRKGVGVADFYAMFYCVCFSLSVMRLFASQIIYEALPWGGFAFLSLLMVYRRCFRDSIVCLADGHREGG